MAHKYLIPGQYLLKKEPIPLVPDRPRMKVVVQNRGDRPIQVGSHYHFFEVNQALKFERKGTQGYRLDIPAGTAVRFEPGETKEIELVRIGGCQQIHGFAGLVNGGVVFESNG